MKFIFVDEHDFATGRAVGGYVILGRKIPTDYDFTFLIGSDKLEWIRDNNFEESFWMSIVTKKYIADNADAFELDCKLMAEEAIATLFALRFEESKIKIRLFIA